MEKPQARRRIQQEITRLTAEDRAGKSRRIADTIMRLPEFTRASVVMLFAPMTDETDTWPIIRAATNEGKIVLFPRVMQGAKKMIACRVEDPWQDLAAGTYNILEPRSNSPFDVSAIDFCLVPARAFDRLGGRLGRGKGYYDRFMADPVFRAIRCGVAFGEQILDEVPSAPHDLPVHVIVTEEEIIRPPTGG